MKADEQELRPPEVAFIRLLGKAQDISERSLEQMRDLSDRFPTALPGSLIIQLERSCATAGHERRRSLRLPGEAGSAPVAAPSALDAWDTAPVVDHSAEGLSLRLDHPLETGIILLVWLGSARNWVPLEVRHCRAEGAAWIVGGELVRRSSPPLAR